MTRRFDIGVAIAGLGILALWGASAAHCQPLPSTPHSGTLGGGPAWSTEAFNIGRLSVAHLPDGARVMRVRIEKLLAAGDAKEVRFE